MTLMARSAESSSSPKRLPSARRLRRHCCEARRRPFSGSNCEALAERLQQVREEERKMVARDLHDQIGQILTAIKMDMTWVVRHLPKSEDEVHRSAEGID